MTLQTTPSARMMDVQWHPLELIPFFRRFPCSFGRNFLYTFIWSTLFGLAFYVMNSLGAERLLSSRVLGLQILIANLVGYSIHALFHAGSALRLEDAARRGGFTGKVVYFSLVPLGGVFIGLWLSSFIIDVGFRGWLPDPAALISLTLTSLVISAIMSVIFFWREREAVAAAELAIERERTQRIEREATLANLRALQAQPSPM